VVQQMPQRTRAQLESECLRRLKGDMVTKDVVRVVLYRLHHRGSGQNWTIIATEPPLTAIGWARARDIVAEIAGTYTMAEE
jgi:hypothetical protein